MLRESCYDVRHLCIDHFLVYCPACVHLYMCLRACIAVCVCVCTPMPFDDEQVVGSYKVPPPGLPQGTEYNFQVRNTDRIIRAHFCLSCISTPPYAGCYSCTCMHITVSTIARCGKLQLDCVQMLFTPMLLGATTYVHSQHLPLQSDFVPPADNGDAESNLGALACTHMYISCFSLYTVCETSRMNESSDSAHD